MKTVDQVNLIEFDMDRLEELVAMWRACFESGVGVKDPHPIEDQRAAFLTDILPKYPVRMAMLDEQLEGFVAASSESVCQLHVRVGCHRLGIGTKLLDWAKSRSSGSLWLYTFDRNKIAQAFYEHHGFVIAERGFEPAWQLEDIKYAWSEKLQDIV